MLIQRNATPPGSNLRPLAPRAPERDNSAPVEPQDAAFLSQADPAQEPARPRAATLALRGGAVALAVAASVAGVAGLAHLCGPAVASVPPQAPVPSIIVEVEAPTPVRTAPWAMTQASGQATAVAAQTTSASAAQVPEQAATQVAAQATAAKAPVAEKKVPDSVAKLTPEFFKNLGDINYGYKSIAKGHFVLTFDDGPNPKVTPKILDTLKEHNIKGAVFFVTGANAQRYPDLVKRIVAEGHVLGDHTWSHPDLRDLSQTKALSELTRTDAAVDKALGYDYPLKLVRPPYGATNSSVLKTIHDKYGGKSVVWQVDSEDWRVQSDIRQGKPTTSLTNRVVSGVKAMDKQGRGGVILMHDIHSNTGKDLDKVLDTLESKGYEIISITDVANSK